MRISKLVAVDEKRCVQSCFRMIAEAFTEEDPGFERADKLTGYCEGRGTWQFRMLLAFTHLGLSAIDHELFDAHLFLRDPEEAIRLQVGDQAVAAQNIADTDLNEEVKALNDCLASPLIQFVNSTPTFDNLNQELHRDRLLICGVNLRVLEDKPGHLGHSVVVEEVNEDSVIIADPAPPGRLHFAVERGLFHRAWTSPSESMANFISVGLP